MPTMIAAQLGLDELVARIPLDANAVVAYAVLVVLLALIWWNKHSERELSPPYESRKPREEMEPERPTASPPPAPAASPERHHDLPAGDA